MDYDIISSDPVTGEIQVAFASTEEVVATCAFVLPRVNGALLSGQALDAEIRSRAPVWRLVQATEATTVTGYDSALTMGEYVSPLGSEPTLEQCKVAKLAQINAFRECALAAGVSFADHVFDSDSASVARLNLVAGVLLAGGVLPEGVVWRSAANADVAMTPKDVLGLQSAMLAHTQQVFRKSWVLKSQVNLAQTVEAVAAVVWSIPGRKRCVPQGNMWVTSGPTHQTTETEIAVDRVVVQ
jgi:hypothetical protein